LRKYGLTAQGVNDQSAGRVEGGEVKVSLCPRISVTSDQRSGGTLPRRSGILLRKGSGEERLPNFSSRELVWEEKVKANFLSEERPFRRGGVGIIKKGKRKSRGKGGMF